MTAAAAGQAPQAPAAQPPPAAPAAPVPQLAPKPSPPKPAKAPPLPPPAFPTAARWSATVDAAPVAPPLVDGGHVVLALRSGLLSARQMTDGKEVWSARLAVDQPLAADGDRVFAVTGTTLHALHGTTGVEAWSAEIGKPSAPIVARGGWVLSVTDGAMTARRAADGDAVWSKPSGTVSERPAIDGTAIYVPVAEGRLVALDLKTGAVRWDQPVGAGPTEPLVYGDRLYLGSDRKRFVCLRTDSGLEDWHWEIGTRLIGPAVADESRVYFTAMDNVLRALSRSNGGQRWRYPLTYRPTRGPMLMGGQIAVPGITAELIGIDVDTGKLTGKLTFPAQLAMGPSFVAPEGADGTPAVVSITGGLTTQWTLSVSMPAVEAPAVAPAK